MNEPRVMEIGANFDRACELNGLQDDDRQVAALAWYTEFWPIAVTLVETYLLNSLEDTDAPAGDVEPDLELLRDLQALLTEYERLLARKQERALAAQGADYVDASWDEVRDRCESKLLADRAEQVERRRRLVDELRAPPPSPGSDPTEPPRLAESERLEGASG